MNNDLISRSALLKDLKEQHDYIMQDPEVGKNMKWCEAVCFNRTVETMESDPAVDAGPKWISTAERLPAIGETVLAFRGDFMEVLVYDKHHGQEDFFYMDECGYWQEAFRPSVTHWMPLPEPPKEG